MINQNDVTPSSVVPAEIPFTASTEVSSTTPNLEHNLMHTKLLEMNISLGQFYPYDSKIGLPVMPEGSRGVKLMYKGKATRASSWVAVPTAHLTEKVLIENATALAPYLLAYLQKTEGAMLKERHAKDESQIFTEYLTLEAITDYLDEQGEGKKLTGEQIKAWFESEVADTLFLLFADKKGITGEPTEEEAIAINSNLIKYMNNFKSCAGGATKLKDSTIQMLQKALVMTETNTSGIGAKIASRLAGMTAKKEEEMESL